MKRDEGVTEVHAELVLPSEPDKVAHLAQQRGLIIHRALLVAAIQGFFPVPVADDRLASRVRAGLYVKLARGRQVDLPPASATVLASPAGPGVAAKLTFAAAAAVAAKFAGRKFLALLAAGRSAEEMARTYASATLFDHYCAKLHVGGPITSANAERLRACLAACVRDGASGPVRSAFAEGSRILGRSLLEAPGWLSRRVTALGERFVRSGGNPDVLEAFPDETKDEAAWIDRAARAVEDAIARAGNEQQVRLVSAFEERWQDSAPGSA
jgi:uncharacterized protein (DUF697 family)